MRWPARSSIGSAMVRGLALRRYSWGGSMERFRLAARRGLLTAAGVMALLGLGFTAVASARNDASSARGRVVTVSGTDTDGSGHEWPLYATLTVDGVGGHSFFTNPFTGRYSMRLPANATYQVHVTA